MISKNFNKALRRVVLELHNEQVPAPVCQRTSAVVSRILPCKLSLVLPNLCGRDVVFATSNTFLIQAKIDQVRPLFLFNLFICLDMAASLQATFSHLQLYKPWYLFFGSSAKYSRVEMLSVWLDSLLLVANFYLLLSSCGIMHVYTNAAKKSLNKPSIEMITLLFLTYAHN